MGVILKGGHAFYGYDIGIMMLDTTFPRPCGDVGNAETWKFPVLYKVIKYARPAKIVLDLKMDDLEPFIAGAKELQAMGVRAITTSCGFLGLFQKELAQALDVPIFTSSLVLLPLLLNMFGQKKILVLTANSDTLTPAHILQACGELDSSKYDIVGTQHKKFFTNFTVQNWNSVDRLACERDIIETLEERFTTNGDDYGAILLECTNMPPYSDAIRKKFNLPVFDFVTLTNFVHSAYCLDGFGK